MLELWSIPDTMSVLVISKLLWFRLMIRHKYFVSFVIIKKRMFICYWQCDVLIAIYTWATELNRSFVNDYQHIFCYMFTLLSSFRAKLRFPSPLFYFISKWWWCLTEYRLNVCNRHFVLWFCCLSNNCFSFSTSPVYYSNKIKHSSLCSDYLVVTARPVVHCLMSFFGPGTYMYL